MHKVLLRPPPSTQVPLLLVKRAMPKENRTNRHNLFWHPKDVSPRCDIERHPDQTGRQPFIDGRQQHEHDAAPDVDVPVGDGPRNLRSIGQHFVGALVASMVVGLISTGHDEDRRSKGGWLGLCLLLRIAHQRYFLPIHLGHQALNHGGIGHDHIGLTLRIASRRPTGTGVENTIEYGWLNRFGSIPTNRATPAHDFVKVHTRIFPSRTVHWSYAAPFPTFSVPQPPVAGSRRSVRTPG